MSFVFGFNFAFAGDPELISAKQGSFTSKPADSSHPSISDDGNLVVFESAAKLTPDDQNKTSDIYVFDRRNRLLRRLGLPDGLRQNARPHVSGDGNTVAFHSYRRNKKKKVIPENADICLFDLATNNASFPIVDAMGETEDGESLLPRLDKDGGKILFISNKDNLHSAAKGGISQIYLFEPSSKSLALISKRADGVPSNRLCGHVRMSADTMTIAYLSAATNFEPELPPNSLSPHLYWLDRRTGKTDRIDLFERGVDAEDWMMGGFDMSDDGSILVFESRRRVIAEPNQTLFGVDLFLYDRVKDKVFLLTTGMFANKSRNPSLSGDGNYVAFILRDGGVIIHERSSDRWQRVASGKCENAVLSRNGDVVVFETRVKTVKNIYIVKNPFKEAK